SYPCGCMTSQNDVECQSTGDANAFFDVWSNGARSDIAGSLSVWVDQASLAIPAGGASGYSAYQSTPVTRNDVHSALRFPTPKFKLTDKGFGNYTVSGVVHSRSSTSLCQSFDWVRGYTLSISSPRLNPLLQVQSHGEPGDTLNSVTVSGDSLLLP